MAATGPRGPTEQDVVDYLERNQIRAIRTESATLDGVLVGKHISPYKLLRSLESGLAFPDFLYATDIAGDPHFGFWAPWRQPFFGDLLVFPDPVTLRAYPWQQGVAGILTDHADQLGAPIPVCGRSLVKSLAAELADRGFTADVALEVEFSAFAEDIDAARERGYRDLTPLGGRAAGPIGGQLRQYRHEPFLAEIRARLAAIGIAWEATHAEAAPGQFEVSVHPADPVTAADTAIRLRQIVKEAALDAGHCATFLSKPHEHAFGTGLHIHHSLTRNGDPAFWDEARDDHRSSTMRRWLGGLMATLPGSVAILAPAITSYRRMVDFVAAPTTATWGEDNKSTAIRTIGRTAELARIEHRVGAAEVNPYLAVAVILAGGLAGLDEALEPPPEFPYLAWGVPDNVPRLPPSMPEAVAALRADTRLRKFLSDDFVDYYANTREWEHLRYGEATGATSATLTDWELTRYFENA